MDNDNVNIHNGYKNELVFLFEANEMGNIKTNSLDVGNSSKSILLEPQLNIEEVFLGTTIFQVGFLVS
jgi:hypothetical protein